MKHINRLLLTFALTGAALTAMGQDVTVIHFKNGNVNKYVNGPRTMTALRYFDFHEQIDAKGRTSADFENGFSAAFGVDNVWHEPGKYCLGIVWKNDIPSDFQASHGVLVGSTPGLSVDACELLGYFSDCNVTRNTGTYAFSGSFSGYQFMTIGKTSKNTLKMKIPGYFPDSAGVFTFNPLMKNANHIDYDFQTGKTYYYRTFAKCKIAEKGKVVEKYFYGRERSIRIPVVMSDEGYYPLPSPSTEAFNDFAKYFTDGVMVPAWESLDGLWTEWKDTDEGKQINLSDYVESKTFEDGTGYRIKAIPQAFYNWLCKREVTIDVFDNLAEIEKMPISGQPTESIEKAVAEKITGVDAKWQLPDNQYMRFSPNPEISSNYSLTYHSYEVIPGVNYRVEVVFAPETTVEKNEETASLFLPTKTFVSYQSGARWKDVFGDTVEVPSDQATTMSNGTLKVETIGTDLQFNTDVKSKEIKNGEYNRILRIAKIRLIPVTE